LQRLILHLWVVVVEEEEDWMEKLLQHLIIMCAGSASGSSVLVEL
jgi:hypothetical protein